MTDLSALVGAEVRRLLLDHQVTLFLVSGPASLQAMSGQLILGAPFRLERDGRGDDVDPARRETLPPVCRLLGAVVTGAGCDDEVLTLSFNDGSTMVAGRHRGPMSWHLLGQGVPHLLVGPG